MASERVRRQVDRLLDQVEAAATALDWDRVTKLCDGVLRLDPDNSDARAFLEAASRQTGVLGAGLSASPPSPVDEPRQESPHPSSFASGRYQVKKFLGEGGKKKVYLAHDSTLDRDVAFALIKSEALDESARKRILREAQAMGRLGDHPNIVPIHDLGTESGQPFMVLPLMQGGDVADVIEKAKDQRPPLAHVLRVAKDVCEGLAFAHSKGIVHRDLKPGNVWLTDEPAKSSERWTAKIGDFGLALPLDQSRLTREGFMVGTVAYMPPEQAMGGEITPRADLYSLGCMLYEMVTGRPPFLGDDDIAIIGQHINTPPVAPSWHRPDCPKPLEALIMRLLAKDPGQRPESAKDVVSALQAIAPASAATTQSTTTAAGPDHGRSLDSISSGVFVGRHKEMDQLRAALEETLSGRGHMVTLVGEPGIGKTRTAQELATYAGLRRCQVLWGRCYEGGGAPPYWPWVQAIRQYVHEKDPDQLRRELGSSATVVAEIVQEVKERIPGIEPPSPLENPESARFRLFDALTLFLKNASRTQPLMFVFDDLHWSDKPGLLLLEFVARELSNSRILLIGTYRDVELNRRHPLAVTLGDLTKERLFERVLLRGLDKDDVAKFVEIAAGVKPPAGLIEAIYTQTEGNPLFVTEVVRLLVQEGELARGKQASAGRKTTTWIVRIPEGVKEVIGRRLDRLSERCNDLLTTAAVIGRRFALSALRQLYADPSIAPEDRLSEDRIIELIEEALAARVIEELPSSPGRYQFTHALIEEALAGELSTTRRVRLHARIALVLEGLYGDRAPERAAELARHFGEAETVLGPQKVTQYSLLAGEQALSSLAFEEALRRFERALAAKGNTQDEESARILLGLGKAQAATLPRHERQRATETLSRAFDYFARSGDRARAIEAASVRIQPIGGTTRASELYDKALKLATDGSVEAGRLLALYGCALGIETDRYEDAAAALRKAMEIARINGLADLDIQSTEHLLEINNHQARELDRQNELALRVLEKARSTGLWESELHAYVYLTGSARRAGDTETARKVADVWMERAKKFRHAHHLQGAYRTSIDMAIDLGEWSTAKALIAEADVATPNDVRVSAALAQVEYSLGNFSAGDVPLNSLTAAMESAAPGPNQYSWEILRSFPLLYRCSGNVNLLAYAERAANATLSRESIEVGRRMLIQLSVAAIHVERGLKDVLASEYEALCAISNLFTPTAHALARVAHAIGRYDSAEVHFTEAIDFVRRARHRPELAWTLSDFAEMLKSRNRIGDVEKAATASDEALAIARELDMKPLIERIIARKKILKA